MCQAASWFSLKVKVAQSCPALCDPMDYTVHGILQVRILEWVAVPFSRGSSQPRDRTQVSGLVGRFFTSCATREAQKHWGLNDDSHRVCTQATLRELLSRLESSSGSSPLY